jgi:hypothetical protein
MARYVECPDEYDGVGSSLFLAGGITGCPDWQADLRAQLGDLPLALLNPRRAISFWFPAEALQPIALYELGAWSMTSKRLFVGADPRYPRRADVVIQTRLARPALTVVDSLASLAAQILQWRGG